MRHFLRFGWAAAVGLAVGGAAAAQTTGNNGSSSSSGLPTAQNSGGSSGTATTMQAPPTIAGTSLADTSTSRSGGAVNASNALGAFYSNPYYAGRAGAASGDSVGGFGVPLYGNTGGGTGTTGQFGTTGSRTSSTSSRGGSSAFGGTSSTGFGGTSSTGFGGTSTGFGGTSTGFGSTAGRAGGLGGLGGTSGLGGLGASGTGSAAQAIAMPRQIAYTAAVRFPIQPMTAPRMHTEARAVLDRSVSLSNPRGIEVVADGSVVVLRGTVKDEDEARLAENMIRLSPGVRDVKNELKFPAP